MKHLFKPVLIITSALLIISCGENQNKEEKTTTNSSQTIDSLQTIENIETKPTEDDTATVKILTKEILSSLKNNDYESLVQNFHPDRGVRFSPYAYIDTSKNVRLSATEFMQAIKSKKKITWGNADGSGDPIILTIPEYFKKFVYNANFLQAEKMTVNKLIEKGNSLNNLVEMYPDAFYTESYDPGKSEMAWSALRLVFTKKSDKFYLIGIVHNQWTI